MTNISTNRKLLTLGLATFVAASMLTLSFASSFAVRDTGRLDLFMVNSGASTTFFNDSVTADGNCSPFSAPASLSLSQGTSLRQDTLAGGLGTVLSFTSDRSFTVPANPNAVILKLWAFSGDTTCPGQTPPQPISWEVTCTGSCGTAVSLTGGPQTFTVGSTLALFNEHAGPATSISVAAGDTITLALGCPGFPPIQWNAPNGQGVSGISILMH